MPHIRIRALPLHQVQQLSATLPGPLSDIMKISADHFTLESIAATFYTQGKPTISFPFIEVLWFARAPEIQDKCAKVITDQVKALTQADDVVVVFKALQKEAYYENGVHF